MLRLVVIGQEAIVIDGLEMTLQMMQLLQIVNGRGEIPSSSCGTTSGNTSCAASQFEATARNLGARCGCGRRWRRGGQVLRGNVLGATTYGGRAGAMRQRVVFLLRPAVDVVLQLGDVHANGRRGGGGGSSALCLPLPLEQLTQIGGKDLR